MEEDFEVLRSMVILVNNKVFKSLEYQKEVELDMYEKGFPISLKGYLKRLDSSYMFSFYLKP